MIIEHEKVLTGMQIHFFLLHDDSYPYKALPGTQN